MKLLRKVAVPVVTMVLLLVPIGFALLLVFGVGMSVLTYGKKILFPDMYWSDEVDQIEGRIKLLSSRLNECKKKAVQSDSEGAQIYSAMVKQGWSSSQALDIVLARRQGIEKSCDQEVWKLISEGAQLSNAKAELQKH